MPYLRVHRRRSVVFLGLACAGILAFALSPWELRLPWSAGDKVQHAVAFAVLAVLASVAMPKWRLWHLLAGLVGFGAVIEVLQGALTVQRDAEFSDLFADSIATILALSAVSLCRRLKHME